MSQEVHHGIENDAGGGPLGADVLRQLHDAVGFATKAAHGCGVVQGVASDGEAVDTKKEAEAPPSAPGGATIVMTLKAGCIEAPSGAIGGACDNAHPRPGINRVYDDPDADDGDEPVACLTKVLP